jgi:RNA polymerase sigma-70 factor (ECF subfamily)
VASSWQLERLVTGRTTMKSRTESPTSFEALVLPHRGLLYRVALKMTGSPAEADDLVQDTLMKAYVSFDRLRPDSQVRPWLLRILHNTFVSSWRRKKRERALFQPGVAEDRAPWLVPTPPRRSPEESVDAGLGDEVEHALAELPVSYRRCVVLVDLEEKSYREAATELGRPLGTIMSRLFRGRRLLQDKLDGYAHQEGFIHLRAA